MSNHPGIITPRRELLFYYHRNKDKEGPPGQHRPPGQGLRLMGPLMLEEKMSLYLSR